MVVRKTSYQGLYKKLRESYGPQGWWPILNSKTLLCEYHTGAPRNDAERTEIVTGCILAQGTQWYPNVVRALQQLKLGRPFTKAELEWIRQAESECSQNSKDSQKATNSNRLTQNTSWKNVEKAISNMASAGMIDFGKIAAATKEAVARLIKPSGYYNQKAERLQLFAQHICDNYGGDVKRLLQKDVGELRSELLELKGIGPETADSIILYAANRPVFVVDAYTRRIFSRIGICSSEAGYDELQHLLVKGLPESMRAAAVFNQYHALLVELGKKSCTKNNPVCVSCPLLGICVYGKEHKTANFK